MKGTASAYYTLNELAAAVNAPVTPPGSYEAASSGSDFTPFAKVETHQLALLTATFTRHVLLSGTPFPDLHGSKFAREQIKSVLYDPDSPISIAPHEEKLFFNAVSSDLNLHLPSVPDADARSLRGIPNGEAPWSPV